MESYSPLQRVSHWASQNPPPGNAHSLPPPTMSRTSDDLDTYSSLHESSSDFSIQSTPEGHSRAGVMDARKLARMINQPMYFKGTRRPGAHYRPRRMFKEWNTLSKRKQLQEETRLLQYSLQKYKTELGLMERAFMGENQAVWDDVADEDRDEIEETEWLYGEVKGQVTEMERLLQARVKAVHAGNDFHSLMADMGVIGKMIDMMKEQSHQHQMSSAQEDRDDDTRDEDGDGFDDFLDDRRGFQSDRRGFQSDRQAFSQSFQVAPDWSRSPRPRPSLGAVSRGHSSSMSNLPLDLTSSLEQMKSSLLSEVKSEIKASTQRLEADIQSRDAEIQRLRSQLQSPAAPSSPATSLTSEPAASRTRWTPKTTPPRRSRSRSHGQVSLQSAQKNRVVGDKLLWETDV